MATIMWSFGDRVVHTQKPEWGAGVVTTAQGSVHEGQPCQLVTIRFERAGIKTLSTAVAALVPASEAPWARADAAASVVVSGSRAAVGARGEARSGDRSGGPGAQGSAPASSAAVGGGTTENVPAEAPLSNPDMKKAMLRLPDDATDPFVTPNQRFAATARLYRFTPTGRSLLDWAAVQSGLADPLSRFNRHELENFFNQWCVGRDNHLRKVAQELKRADAPALKVAIASAPHGVQQTLRRLDALR